MLFLKSAYLLFAVVKGHSEAPFCKYDVQNSYEGENSTLSEGFAWFATYPGTWPRDDVFTGTGTVLIDIPEDEKLKDWVIQLRWPIPMEDVGCYTDKTEQMDDEGYVWHITPHFWDANTDNIMLILAPMWLMDPYIDEYNITEPIPCVDYCTEMLPEKAEPCVTQPPTTTPRTTTTRTTTVETTTNPISSTTTAQTTTEGTDDCQERCDGFLVDCLGYCEGISPACHSDCNRDHYDCIKNCRS